MDGHQIAHWDGATWQGFHSPKKTCTIFKKSTILQSTHHDQLEASKYQWRFKTYQGRISSFFLPREAKSWDSWLQDAPLDMLQGQLGYGSEHAPAGHVPHGLLLCIWGCEVTSSLRIMKLRPLLKRYRPHGAILHSALLPKTWASENTTFQQYGLCRICPCNARSVMLISAGISTCSPAVLSRYFKIRAHAEPKNQGLCKFSGLAANHMQGASQELSGPTNRQDFR